MPAYFWSGTSREPENQPERHTHLKENEEPKATLQYSKCIEVAAMIREEEAIEELELVMTTDDEFGDGEIDGPTRRSTDNEREDSMRKMSNEP